LREAFRGNQRLNASFARVTAHPVPAMQLGYHMEQIAERRILIFQRQLRPFRRH
jgi:hypothetical protein